MSFDSITSTPFLSDTTPTLVSAKGGLVNSLGAVGPFRLGPIFEGRLFKSLTDSNLTLRPALVVGGDLSLRNNLAATPTWTLPTAKELVIYCRDLLYAKSSLASELDIATLSTVDGSQGVQFNCIVRTHSVAGVNVALGTGINFRPYGLATATAAGPIVVPPNSVTKLAFLVTTLDLATAQIQITIDSSSSGASGGNTWANVLAAGAHNGTTNPIINDTYTLQFTGPVKIGTSVTATLPTQVAIGNLATASGGGAVSIGLQTAATGDNGVAIGTTATAAAVGVAIGESAIATVQGVAIGFGTSATHVAGNNVAIGQNTTANGTLSIGIGSNVISSATSSIAIGSTNVTASGTRSLAIGASSLANNTDAIAIGSNNTTATGAQAISIGKDADATNTDTISIGNASNCTGLRAIALGQGTVASGNESVAIGSVTTTATALQTIAIGKDADATGTTSVAIGVAANATTTNTIAIGNGTQSTGAGGSGVAIGAGANASGGGAMALHWGATGSGSSAIAVGGGSTASATNSLAVGISASATHTGTGCFGYGATSTYANSIVLGSTANQANGIVHPVLSRFWHHIDFQQDASYTPTLVSVVSAGGGGFTVTTTSLASGSTDAAGMVLFTITTNPDGASVFEATITFAVPYLENAPVVTVTAGNTISSKATWLSATPTTTQLLITALPPTGAVGVGAYIYHWHAFGRRSTRAV